MPTAPPLRELMGRTVRPLPLTVSLAVGTLAAVAYWYVGSPGPVLIDGTARSDELAQASVGWAVALLLVVPLVVALAFRRPLSELGFRVGDASFGIKSVLIVTALMAVPMIFGGRDPAVQAAYPWPGLEVGASWGSLGRWWAIYLVYYVAFELFFRGFLIDTIRPHWGDDAANWTQAIACTLIHVGKPMAETFAALPASLLFGLLAIRSRSLVWPVLLHFSIATITDLASLYWQGRLPW